MAEEYKFDFITIPIPVDSRVKKFTARVNPELRENSEIRYLWGDVLSALKKHEPRITMIHLDSLIWQITHLTQGGLCEYFDNLGMGKVKCYTFLQ